MNLRQKIFLSLCAISIFLTVHQVPGQTSSDPWVQTFTPKRTFYVSPTGTGSGTSISSPMKLASALTKATAGDLFCLLQGTYKGALTLKKNGTSVNPIVFRANPGHRAIIEGYVEMAGSNNWIWGLEITDPAGTQHGLGSGVSVLAPGSRVINNIIHHQYDKNGIGVGDKGSGHVIYGNVVYLNGQGPRHPHNLYIQNNFSIYGYKYIVHNMFLDSSLVDRISNNVQAYTQGGYISGLHFEKNISGNGRFLIGGYNAPAERNVVHQNYLYKSSLQIGYGSEPTQARITENYIARGRLQALWFWGAGEVMHPQSEPNVITDNEILFPAYMEIRTYANLSNGACAGCPRFQTADLVDRNKYYDFTGMIHAGNKKVSWLTLTTWRSTAAAAGNPFDRTSSMVPKPTGSKIVLLPNQYDSKRAHLAIFNWAKSQNVTVDLSTVLPSGAQYEIFLAQSAHLAPLITGTYSGPISIQTGGAEFAAYLIRRK